MYCLELIKLDVFNTSYYVEVQNGALLRDIAQSWKTIPGGHGKFLGKSYGNPGSCKKMFKKLCDIYITLG